MLVTCAPKRHQRVGYGHESGEMPEETRMKRLKALEEEYAGLKRLVAGLSLDNVMLRDAVGRKW